MSCSRPASERRAVARTVGDCGKQSRFQRAASVAAPLLAHHLAEVELLPPPPQDQIAIAIHLHSRLPAAWVASRHTHQRKGGGGGQGGRAAGGAAQWRVGARHFCASPLLRSLPASDTYTAPPAGERSAAARHRDPPVCALTGGEQARSCSADQWHDASCVCSSHSSSGGGSGRAAGQAAMTAGGSCTARGWAASSSGREGRGCVRRPRTTPQLSSRDRAPACAAVPLEQQHHQNGSPTKHTLSGVRQLTDANFPVDAEGRTYHLGTRVRWQDWAGGARRRERGAAVNRRPAPPNKTRLPPPSVCCSAGRWPTASCRWVRRSARCCWRRCCSRRCRGARSSCWRAAAGSLLSLDGSSGSRSASSPPTWAPPTWT